MENFRITKTNVTQQIISYIRHNIENGIWPAGSRIDSEVELAERLGVSRASVRGALKHFIAMGVIESIQGRGTFVKNQNVVTLSNAAADGDFEDYTKIMQFRSTIESETTFLAATKATPHDIAELEDILKRFNDPNLDTETYVKIDVEFHKKIAEMSGNNIYKETLCHMFNLTSNAHIRLCSGNKNPGRYYHAAILDEIRKHNPVRARAVMLEHLGMIIDLL